MPLIQRNLFPSRPPSKKGDGPSVLRATNNNQQQQTITNPILTMYTSSNKLKSLDSSSKMNNGDNKKKKDASKKLRKSHSASMISLLAINQPNNGQQNETNGSSRKNNGNNKINYDSQDSFNSSDASCSDPQSLCSSSSSVDNMISRRRILSRSRDALNNSTCTSDDYSSTGGYNPAQFDEDVWHNKNKLISDHVEEVITKWDQIDDEIWAKVICMERNRRIAKAYARTPILTINGYEAGFDGHRIGLNGFKNPMRDKKTADIKNRIEDGFKLRMDENGSLLIKRLTDLDVFILSFDKMDNCIGEKIEQKKSIVLFDMKQYQNDLLREIKSPMSNLRLLEQKCFSFVAFSNIADDLLNIPVWCIIINLVALEMLVKLMPYRISDDNFYSLPLSLSSKTNGAGYFNGLYSPLPPKLPPRDLNNKKPPLTLPEPDYEDDNNENVILTTLPLTKSIPPKIVDDPYYHGLSAHVPKFAHPGRQASLVKVNNPPIVRKAMNRKLWPYNSSSISSWSSSNNNNNFQQLNDAGHYLPFNEYNNTKNGHSQFDPMTLLPGKPLPPIINDNNEIYGVNPSLLRKNHPFHVRSSSSPSLKNIFSRKKSTNGNNNKDYNNNNKRIH